MGYVLGTLATSTSSRGTKNHPLLESSPMTFFLASICYSQIKDCSSGVSQIAHLIYDKQEYRSSQFGCWNAMYVIQYNRLWITTYHTQGSIPHTRNSRILAMSKRFLKRLILHTTKIWPFCWDLGGMQYRYQSFLKTLRHCEY